MKIIGNIFAYVLVILAMSACNKEIEQDTPSEKPSSEQMMDIIYGRMTDTPVKTSYDEEGQFIWVNTDQVIVIAHADDNANNQRCFTYSTSDILISNAGKYASFTGSIDSGYEKTAFAAYPTSLAANNSNSGYGGAYVKLPSSVSGTLSSTILIGVADGDEYQFHTGTSVFKVSISNIPAVAAKVRLVSADKAHYPLDGDFALEEEDGVVTLGFDNYHSEWKKYDKGYLNVNLPSHEDGTSMEFYFNVPVGEYPAGKLSIQLLDSNEDPIFEKIINKAITSVRNELLTLPLLTVDELWTTLGTGKFRDAFYTDNVKLDGWDWADVTIQKSVSNANRYRLINPYGAFSTKNNYNPKFEPDRYLVLTVNPSNDLVSFDRHLTGLTFGSKDYLISHTQRPGGTTYTDAYSKVVTKDGAGNPLSIQLAPYYLYKDLSNGYSRTDKEGLVMILFPGFDTSCSLASPNAVTDENVSISASGTNISKIKIGVSASSATEALESIKASNYNDLAGTIDASTGISKSVTTTGKYYLAVKGYDSGGREVFRDVQNIYHISSTQQTDLVGTYEHSEMAGRKWVFSESDNLFKGNIRLTGYPAWSMTSDMYGVFDGTNMTFDGKKTIFTSHTDHCIGGWDGSKTSIKDIVFEVSSGSIQSNNICIGKSVAIDANGLITSFAVTSHIYAGNATWNRQSD